MRSRLTTTALCGLSALSNLTACALPVAPDVDAVVVSEQALRSKQTKNPFAGGKYLEGRDKRGPQAVQVRFRDGLKMRLKGGQPVDLSGRGLRDKESLALLEKLKDGTWQRSFLFAPDKLDELRAKVEKVSGEKAPDLNRYFTFSPPKGMALSEALAALELFADIQLVYPMATYEVAAPTEDYRFPRPNALPYQQHLMAPEEGGLGVLAAWDHEGGDGEGVDFFDVEFAFEPAHYELSNVTGDYAGWTAAQAFPNAPQHHIDHGTASMGVVAADARAPGITGTSPAAKPHFVSVNGIYDLPYLVAEYCAQIENNQNGCNGLESAVLYPLVTEDMGPGGVMLLELQTSGPNAPPGGITTQNQFGAVPVEYVPAVHDAIRMLSLSGMVVVEAAGNGTQDLSDPIYSSSAHQPFRVVNGQVPAAQDSMAIMVGAATSGAAWGWQMDPTDVNSPPLPTGLLHKYSNHGPRIDIHGYGDSVVSSGYGSMGGSGTDAYTYNYSGTSSSSAVVAGVVTSLQGVYKSDCLNGNQCAGFTSYLRGPAMRRLLKRTDFISDDFFALSSAELQAIDQSIYGFMPKAEAALLPDVKAAVETIKTNDPNCGAPLAAPEISVAPSTTLVRNGDGYTADIGIHFSDRAPLDASRGLVDIVYTTDGSDPNCVPRLGNCDLDRVHALTQVTAQLSDGRVVLDMSDGPVNVRARQVSLWGSCGTRWGNEISLTLY